MIAWVAKDLDSRRVVQHDGARIMPAFSTVKVLIACAFWRAVERGDLREARPYAFQPWSSVGGAGVLRGFRHAARITLADLAHLSLVVSDNDAANVVLAFTGHETVAATAAELGLADTTVQRAMMDTAAVAAGRDNVSSCRDLARLMEELVTGERLSAAVRDPVLRSLEQSEHTDGLPRYLPLDTVYAGKQGDDAPDGVHRHDCGVLRLGGQTIVMAVMSDAGEGYEGVARTAERLVADLAAD
jgi:beta-lactamase class A